MQVLERRAKALLQESTDMAALANTRMVDSQELAGEEASTLACVRSAVCDALARMCGVLVLACCTRGQPERGVAHARTCTSPPADPPAGLQPSCW